MVCPLLKGGHMNVCKLIPDELLKEALFLSLEDQDLEVRLRKLEEMLEDLNEDEQEGEN